MSPTLDVERVLKPTDVITGFLQYHTRSNRRKGVLCAQYDHKMRQFRIGWSLCARNRGDKFNPAFGRKMALNRMIVRGAWVDMTDEDVLGYGLLIPPSLERDYGRVIKRLAAIHNKSLERERVANMPLIQKIATGIASAVTRLDQMTGVDVAGAADRARVEELSHSRI